MSKDGQTLAVLKKTSRTRLVGDAAAGDEVESRWGVPRRATRTFGAIVRGPIR